MVAAKITRRKIESEGPSGLIPAFLYEFPGGQTHTQLFSNEAERDELTSMSDSEAIRAAQRLVKFEIHPED